MKNAKYSDDYVKKSERDIATIESQNIRVHK